MAAITGTLVGSTFSRGAKSKTIYVTATPTAASDTVTLTAATHGLRTILAVGAFVNQGQDANLMTAHCTFSGLVITVATLGADGSAATDWTSASITLIIHGTV